MGKAARRLGVVASAALCLTAAAGHPATSGPARHTRQTVEVRYTSRAALRRAVAARPAELVRLVAPLRVAELRPSRAAGAYARQIRRAAGIAGARLTVPRRPVDLQQASADDVAGEWQYYSVGVERVPRWVAAAAARLTIAVVDTGADVTSPALAHKVRGTYNARTGRRRVRDTNGHGTFVASLAGGVRRRADGFVGFGGAARLLVVKVSRSTSFSDVAVAGGIVYAVRHPARIVNLSVAGRTPSIVEQAAIEYAARHGVLVVAAAGNDALAGDPPEYPAAFLQPVGSNGIGGLGISVGASDSSGARAAFSEFGSFVSLAAPGESVFGARLHGTYGYASGTSFAAPEVAGVAALVWAADPKLTFRQVAAILKRSATGQGIWSPDLGFGVIDAAAAVRRAAAAASAGS